MKKLFFKKNYIKEKLYIQKVTLEIIDLTVTLLIIMNAVELKSAFLDGVYNNITLALNSNLTVRY